MKKNSFKKLIKFEDIQKKRTRSLKFGIIVLIFIIIITIIALYIANSNFKRFVDVYILKKEIYESNSATLTVDSSSTSLIYSFNNHVLTLDNGSLNFYDSSANLSNTLNVSLSNPIADSNGKYLVLGDKNLQKLYLIHNNDIEWEKNLEANILKVNVNKNGYVSVIATDSTYESIVVLYDSSGNEIFKKFLSSTYAISSDISKNNDYLAVAEIDYSGINIQSKVEIISVSDAINNTDKAVKNTYNADVGKLILSIRYQDNNNLICQLDDCILSITPDKTNNIYSKSNSTVFLSSDISKSYVRIDKESSGILNSDYRMKISDLNGNEHVYVIEGVVKSMKTSDKIIAINLGKQINFINTNGWLVKKYISSKEIKDVILSDKIAAIIYKDKIDIISL